MSWLLDLLSPGLRMASPLVLSSMGGTFTQLAGIWNIGLEGYMLFSAFFAVWIGQATGSIWLALLAGLTASVLAALLMAVLVIALHADEIIVGIALNLVASFLTAYLLDSLTAGGGFMRTQTAVPMIVIPGIHDIPILGDLLSGYDILVYVSWIAVLVTGFIVYRTQFGLQLRATGEDPESAAAAGVNVRKVKYVAFGVSGLLAGLAGFQLAVSFLQLFSQNMSAGRGIIAFAAVIFGRAHPYYTALAALIFGFAQALANQLSTINVPSQFVLMVPYILTIVVLFAAAIRRGRQRVKQYEIT